MKVVVSQKGSRRHYIVPRAFYKHNKLALCITDWYSPFGSSKFAYNLKKFKFEALNRALSAYSDKIPRNLIKSFNIYGMFSRINFKFAKNAYEFYIKNGKKYAIKVSRIKLPEHNVFHGFSYSSLEAIEKEKERGKFCILDQIDPALLNYKLEKEEAYLWPDYVNNIIDISDEFFNRVQKEWNLADLIIANSEWTKNAIIQQGAQESKIEVLPLAYEKNINLPPQKTPQNRSIKVLFLGSVRLLKGIQYLVEAAILLEKEPVEFIIAGHLGIRAEAVSKAPKNMKWLGVIPRSQVSQIYQECDIFILPTLSDGFALTQLEALAHGLPVIVTPNCGRVVDNGITGFIIEPKNSMAIVDAILKFIQSPYLIEEMSRKCLEKAKTYSLNNYSHKLIEIIEKHI